MIKSVRLHLTEIPFRMSVEHALAARKAARNVVVELEWADGTLGYGECCPRPYVTGETVESVITDLRDRMIPGLLKATPTDLEAATSWADAQVKSLRREHHAAFCALELALLDLHGRRENRPGAEFMGPIRHESLNYSGVVAADDIKGATLYAGLMKKFGINEIKVKVAADLDQNLALLETVREIIGPEIRLRIDANCAWDTDEGLRQLEAMKPFDLAGVEQPAAADDLDSMRRLTEAGITPVVADESLCTRRDAELLAEQRACDVFNIRISKNGGLVNAKALSRIAAESGIKCQLGAQVGETAILSAAGRQFACRHEGLLWHEGSYGAHLLEGDIGTIDIAIGRGGAAQALHGPGLGIDIAPDRLADYSPKTLTLLEV